MAQNTLATVQKNNVKSTEYWELRLLKMIVMDSKNYVLQTLGIEKKIPTNSGTTTISLHRQNHLPVSATGAVTALTEGVAPTALKVEYQKVQGTVHQYGNYIEITDWVDDISFDKIKADYQPELSRIANEEIELKIIDSFADASERYVNGRTSKNSISATDVLTLKDCRLSALTMKNYHRNGHTKFGGKPVVVVHPNVMQDLLEDSTLLNNILTPANEAGPMKDGTLEKYKAYGMFFQESLMCPVAKNTASTPVNVYTSYMLGENPYAVIKMSNIKWYDTGFKADKTDPLGQRATFGYKHWFGAKVLDPMAVTRIYSASAFDISADFSNDAIGRQASQA